MPCPSGKILNPKTGRCVSKDGEIGRMILESKSPKAKWDELKKLKEQFDTIASKYGEYGLADEAFSVLQDVVDGKNPDKLDWGLLKDYKDDSTALRGLFLLKRKAKEIHKFVTAHRATVKEFLETPRDKRY